MINKDDSKNAIWVAYCDLRADYEQLRQERDLLKSEVILTRVVTADFIEQQLMDLGHEEAALEAYRIAKDYRVDFESSIRESINKPTSSVFEIAEQVLFSCQLAASTFADSKTTKLDYGQLIIDELSRLRQKAQDEQK